MLIDDYIPMYCMYIYNRAVPGANDPDIFRCFSVEEGIAWAKRKKVFDRPQVFKRRVLPEEAGVWVFGFYRRSIVNPWYGGDRQALNMEEFTRVLRQLEEKFAECM